MRVLEHLAFRLFTVVMILIDVAVVIADLITQQRWLEVISLIIVTYFMVELLARIFAKG